MEALSCSVAPIIFHFFGGPTKNGLPKKGSLFLCRVTGQLRIGLGFEGLVLAEMENRSGAPKTSIQAIGKLMVKNTLHTCLYRAYRSWSHQ